MPNKITRYKCTQCGEEFNSFEAAEECESSHIPISDAKAIGYDIEFMGTPDYPSHIEVAFSDGSYVEYKRC